MAQKPVQMDDSNNVLEVLGQFVQNGDLVIGGFGAGSGIISPTTLGGAGTDNWTPTGIQTASVIRATPGGAINLSGIIAPVPPRGKLMILTNLDVTNAITLKHLSTSVAANQFSCPNGADASLRALSTVFLWYDVTAAKWLVFGL